MADPRLILGRISRVNGPEQGPAREITYRINVHDPNIDGVFTLDDQRPVKRWPPEVDIVAYAVGDIVVGSMEANRVRWHFVELPAFAECPTVEPPAPIISPEDPLVIAPITPFPNVTNYAQAGSSQSAPAPPPVGE
jgi:hypothetical protein